jgi:hypothetical protein
LEPQLNIDETHRLEDTLKFCHERAYKQRYTDDNVAASVKMVGNKVKDGSVDMIGNKVEAGLVEMVGKEEDEEALTDKLYEAISMMTTEVRSALSISSLTGGKFCHTCRCLRDDQFPIDTETYALFRSILSLRPSTRLRIDFP